jgi:hypothetical protein
MSWNPSEQDFAKAFARTIMELVMSAIDMKLIKFPEAATGTARSEAKKAALEHIKGQLADDVTRLNIQTKVYEWLESRVVNATEERDRQRESSKKTQDHFYERLEEFSKNDATTQRLMTCEEPIYRMLPLPDEGTHAYQQALRSRALVIAALCGLTHYGYPQTSKEDSTAKQGAAR